MLKKKHNEKLFEQDGQISLIAETAQLTGDLAIKGAVRIDGKLEGTITEAQSVVVGQKGFVSGGINAAKIVINGAVSGNVNASEFAELVSGCSVEGNVNASKLIIEEGAVFNGNCKMPPVS